MKRLMKRLASVLLVCLFVTSMAFSAFAATGSSVSNKYASLKDEDKSKIHISSDSVDVNGTSVACSSSSGDGLAVVNLGGDVVYMNQEQINALDSALSAFATSAENARNDKGAKGAKEKIGALEKSFDIGADMESSGQAMSGFKKPISIVIGMILYAVVILFGLVTALDLAYITIPFVRIFCDDKGQVGSLSGKTSDGGSKFKFVSDEAVYAVKQNTLENGKNPLTMYIGKRIFGTIMLGIAIFMLATNNLGLLMKISLNLVSGIIDVLIGLAG